MPEKEKTELFIKKILYKFPNTKVTFDKTHYLGTHIPTIITCPIHGDQTITPNYYLNQVYDCPKCGTEISRKKLEELDKLASEKVKNEFVNIVSITHHNKYDYSKVKYVNDATKIEIVCPEHGSFFVTPNKHKNRGTGCPKCNQRHQSYPEYAFSGFLLTLRVDFQEQYRIPEIKKMPYDFYIPKFNLLIEIQGAQHFKKKWNMTDEDLANRCKIDELKRKTAIANNFAFISLKESNLGIYQLKKIADALNDALDINDLKNKLNNFNISID